MQYYLLTLVLNDLQQHATVNYSDIHTARSKLRFDLGFSFHAPIACLNNRESNLVFAASYGNRKI